jgi:hypothetical protein
MNRLPEVLAREEIVDKQHSRIHWLKARDRNMRGGGRSCESKTTIAHKQNCAPEMRGWFSVYDS